MKGKGNDKANDNSNLKGLKREKSNQRRKSEQ